MESKIPFNKIKNWLKVDNIECDVWKTYLKFKNMDPEKEREGDLKILSQLIATKNRRNY